MKKNTKRILSFVLSCVFAFSGFQSVTAENTDRLEKAKNLLSALDIVDDDTNKIVTREQFADIYIRANNLYREGYVAKNPFDDTDDSEYADSIAMMRDYGLVKGVGNNCFAPGEKMMMADIAKLYVSALGMDAYVQMTGKNYQQVAYEFDLFDDVVMSDYITMDNLIIMTYNFLMAPIGAHNLSNEVSYSINRETDALYEKFGVFKITGQLTQNELSGIWSSAGADEGYVVIRTNDGEFEALEMESNIASMLGHTLDVYLYEGEEEYEVVCYEKKSNEKSMLIDISNVNFDKTDNSVICYKEEGKTTEKYETLANFPAFIINGIYYDAGQFNIDVLSNYSGQIKLISSDKNIYDIVVIDAYTDYFVKNVEHYDGNMHIYDSGSNETLILNDTVYKNMELYYPNGAKASPFEIQAGMLLTVAKSFDTQTSIRIYISDRIEEGTISNYNYDDRTLRMDNGLEFNISPSYNASNVSVEGVAKLYINMFDKVAWVEYNKTAVYSWAYMKRPRIDYEENKVVVKAVVESGKFTTMNLADRVKIDGYYYTNNDQKLFELENIPKYPNLVAGEYPFRYRLNKDGEIREIDTPRVRAGYEDRYSFRHTSDGTAVICSNDKILGKSTPLSSSTVMFLIPEATATDEMEDPAFYTVGNSSLLNTGGDNTFTAFKIGNESLYADLVIRTQKSIGGGFSHDNTLFLIDKIQDAYDEKSQDIRTKIFGLEGGSYKEYFLHEQFDKTKLTGIKRGDVVRFSFYSGEIADLEEVFIYNDVVSTYTGQYFLPSGGQKASNLNQIGTSYYYAGYVMRREGRLIEILPFDLAAGDSGVNVPNIPDWSIETRRVFQAPTKISIYDPSLGGSASIYSGDMEDIPTYEDGMKYAKVIVRYRSRSAQEMIVLKDESLFR